MRLKYDYELKAHYNVGYVTIWMDQRYFRLLSVYIVFLIILREISEQEQKDLEHCFGSIEPV